MRACVYVCVCVCVQVCVRMCVVCVHAHACVCHCTCMHACVCPCKVYNYYFQGDGYVGMMRYSATGSAYEKDMSDVIPLLEFKNKFHRYLGPYGRRLLTEMCHFDVRRNVGKWGRLKTYIERGNMYRLHYSKPSTSWIIQQNLYVRYFNKNGKWSYYHQILSYMIN